MWPEVARIQKAIRNKEAFHIGTIYHVGPTEAKALKLISQFLNSSRNWVAEDDGLSGVIWRPQHKSLYGKGTPA